MERNMNGETDRVIKQKTRSICPVCLAEVDARVYEKNQTVYMSKECLMHGYFETRVEDNPEFYKAMCNQEQSKGQACPQTLSISLTSRCNLKCNICFASPLDGKDVPLESIHGQITRFKGKMVWLTGGEPTLRDDLPEIIRFICSCKKIPVIITNGLKLVDKDYVLKLKKAGLHWVHFSFNGFDDASYEAINNKRLYRSKIQALRNLKKLRMNVALSFLYLKGINDFELKQIISFCLQSHSFIRQLRIRAGRKIGKGSIQETVHLSQLLAHIAKILNSNLQSLLESGVDINTTCISAYSAAPMPCHHEIDLVSFLKNQVTRPKANKFMQVIEIACWVINCFGLRVLLNIVIEHIAFARGSYDFTIKIRAWFDKNNIDLEEIKRCVSVYAVDNCTRVMPFCLALVVNEKKQHLF